MSQIDIKLSGSIIYLIAKKQNLVHELSEILTDEDYIVTLFSTVDKAIIAMQEKKPDLIVNHIQLPWEDRDTICAFLKRDKFFCRIPVIFLFDDITRSVKEKAYTEGCVDMIILPPVRGEIISKVKMHLLQRKYEQRFEEIDHSKKSAILSKTVDDSGLFRKRDQETGDELSSRIQGFVLFGELISALAHEIRQPLHGMKLIIEGIIYWETRNKEINEKSQKNLDYLSKVIQGIDRIDNVITNVYKSITYKNTIMIEPVNFNEIIREELDVSNNKLQKHEIKITCNLDPQLSAIQCTLFHAQQVVTNLLRNAMKALEKTNRKKKCISILTQEMKEYIIFEISDNGPGIKDELKEKIFNPLFTTDQETESNGMGLYIVHSILIAYSSDIDVFNNPKEGVTFRIKFRKG